MPKDTFFFLEIQNKIIITKSLHINSTVKDYIQGQYSPSLYRKPEAFA
jgi:hypothetical protein